MDHDRAPLKFRDPRTGATALHYVAAFRARPAFGALTKGATLDYMIRNSKGRLAWELAFNADDTALARLLTPGHRAQFRSHPTVSPVDHSQASGRLHPPLGEASALPQDPHGQGDFALPWTPSPQERFCPRDPRPFHGDREGSLRAPLALDPSHRPGAFAPLGTLTRRETSALPPWTSHRPTMRRLDARQHGGAGRYLRHRASPAYEALHAASKRMQSGACARFDTPPLPLPQVVDIVRYVHAAQPSDCYAYAKDRGEQ